MLSITIMYVIQNNFTEIWDFEDCYLCVLQNQFYRKEPHLVMLGHIMLPVITAIKIALSGKRLCLKEFVFKIIPCIVTLWEIPIHVGPKLCTVHNYRL